LTFDIYPSRINTDNYSLIAIYSRDLLQAAFPCLYLIHRKKPVCKKASAA